MNWKEAEKEQNAQKTKEYNPLGQLDMPLTTKRLASSPAKEEKSKRHKTLIGNAKGEWQMVRIRGPRKPKEESQPKQKQKIEEKPKSNLKIRISRCCYY